MHLFEGQGDTTTPSSSFIICQRFGWPALLVSVCVARSERTLVHVYEHICFDVVWCVFATSGTLNFGLEPTRALSSRLLLFVAAWHFCTPHTDRGVNYVTHIMWFSLDASSLPIKVEYRLWLRAKVLFHGHHIIIDWRSKSTITSIARRETSSEMTANVSLKRFITDEAPLKYMA